MISFSRIIQGGKDGAVHTDAISVSEVFVVQGEGGWKGKRRESGRILGSVGGKTMLTVRLDMFKGHELECGYGHDERAQDIGSRWRGFCTDVHAA